MLIDAGHILISLYDIYLIFGEVTFQNFCPFFNWHFFPEFRVLKVFCILNTNILSNVYGKYFISVYGIAFYFSNNIFQGEVFNFVKLNLSKKTWGTSWFLSSKILSFLLKVLLY